MIVGDKYRFVYVAIPRTASHSVNNWLKRNYKGRRMGFYHAWNVPHICRDYTVFVTVRNPYERCFSYWWLSCKMSLVKGVNPAGCSFKDFMALITKYKWGHGDDPFDGNVPEIHMPQAGYFKKSGADVFIKLEGFYQEVEKKLSFVNNPIPKLPKIHKSKDKPKGISFHDYFGKEEEQMVWDYCHEDFTLFGYERVV